MKQQCLHVLLAGIALACGSACAVDPRFGELPRGPASTAETRGVDAEICRDHLFDPDTVKVDLPVGYRLVLAAEAAKKNPALASLMHTAPALTRHAVGSLCLMSFRSFTIDGTPVHSGKPTVAAFWWASTTGPRHVDMRGKADWTQLGSWYASNTPHRAAILRTDPMAQFVEIDLAEAEPDAWRLRLALPGETVEADIRLSGEPRMSEATQPGYLSVPMSGASSTYFSVYTYYGHRHRSARGRWRTTGKGVFSKAFGIQGESAVFETVFQEGWASRSGLYRFAPR